MSHFAKVVEGLVTQVIVAEPEFIEKIAGQDQWVQTSYNTRGGVHLLGGEPLRKNFAGVGYSYNLALDAFIPPKPFPSWNLNEESCLWESPLPRPNDGQAHKWDENTLSWVTE